MIWKWWVTFDVPAQRSKQNSIHSRSCLCAMTPQMRPKWGIGEIKHFHESKDRTKTNTPINCAGLYGEKHSAENSAAFRTCTQVIKDILCLGQLNLKQSRPNYSKYTHRFNREIPTGTREKKKELKKHKLKARQHRIIVCLRPCIMTNRFPVRSRCGMT